MKSLTEGVSSASKIRPLSDKVANQIAAGEVVERPASIIKELVENALDAKAASITIIFRNGGKSYIEVVDDGVGMSRDDALLAFERHATSKIETADDLKSVSTLGFRGEALPSIASVSRLSLFTSLDGAKAGTEVAIEGGSLKNVREAPPVRGTRIQARDIFFNTPARRKFLRSESVESAHAQEAVTRQALAKPDTAFRLVREGRVVLEAPAVEGKDAFRERIGALFGQNILRELTDIRSESGGMRIDGYISRPSATRSSRETQYIYVNGRYIRDRMLNFAIAEGYRSLVPRGRHPMIFLRITIPPERVDVNVSPTKTELRFVDGRSVKAFVEGAVADALGIVKERSDNVFAKTQVPVKPDTWSDNIQTRPFAPSRFFAEPVATFDSGESVASLAETTEQGPDVEEDKTETGLLHFDSSISENFKPVGQIFSSFIILEDGERALILDQHTAHERVLYERLSLKYRDSKVDSQELLFPMEIELSGRYAEFMGNRLDEFKRLGFFIEEFGNGVFMLRSAPALLAGKDYTSMVMDIMDKAESFEKEARFDEIAEDAINIMACRGAVKAGQTLDNKEIESLVTQLKKCKLPYTCPHGRPIAMTIEKDDLLKGFLRK
ncbi:DNA mismatch repair protein MutL [hydrothermal vent metagenome]|uniref:DNA mismatch repair protein MutL n=1 Tax=hydrothermal vent metagenome TaxID=652676 RepID=A0A3B1CTN4_9ZZZZ